MVRAPPPNWPLPIYSYNWTGVMPDLNATIDQGIEYMREAKENGANLIMFPELWFPGFPKGALYNNWTNTHLATYIENTMVVGGVEWNRLIAAIKEVEIYAALSFAQRVGDNLYMALALVSPLGDELIFRHKLRPSGDERDIFSDGTMDQLRVITSAFGRVGMLECGEHWYPSMTFPMQAQVENFHIGPFPYMGDPGDENYLWWEGAEANRGAVGLYSNLAGAYSFVAAVGYSFVSSPLAQVVTHTSAKASFDDHPMLYHSLDTTTFNKSETYNADSQVSWGVLQQIYGGFPAYIPDIEGTLVPERNVSINYLLTGALNSSTVDEN
ncbi:aliphatic nitrilase [Aspergillus sclerotiicarbonarius CBS 121057]|uniref:nitrilase n=1 Tax=Aspergillus sclerotiicarbonarius (strain CBS 121057 / IBT 28362) TaxID=1448318 RepID=A0A319EPN2_ASPSB|nr:aliphatic nitrilase [Aspergillus sclerotiicarbonarius CBS 121057]